MSGTGLKIISRKRHHRHPYFITEETKAPDARSRGTARVPCLTTSPQPPLEHLLIPLNPILALLAFPVRSELQDPCPGA